MEPYKHDRVYKIVRGWETFLDSIYDGMEKPKLSREEYISQVLDMLISEESPSVEASNRYPYSRCSSSGSTTQRQ